MHRGAWGVQRLGLLFSISASASWGAQPEASLQLRAGQSAQLLSWWGGRGDLSVGVLGSAQTAWSLNSSASSAAFAWLTLPITSAALLWVKAERELIPSEGAEGRWAAQLQAAWRFTRPDSASLAVIAELKRGIVGVHLTPLSALVGLRLQ